MDDAGEAVRDDVQEFLIRIYDDSALSADSDFLALKERNDFGFGAFQPCHKIIRQWLPGRQFYAAFPQGNTSTAVLDRRNQIYGAHSSMLQFSSTDSE
jgi:hypothetical protein